MDKNEDGDMDGFIRKVIKLGIIYAFILAIVIIIFNTLLMLSLIPSESMEDTICKGDVVIATRFGIKEDNIERYDILIFTLPDDPKTDYIKRVIGLPGDVVEVSNGKVYANGEELDDSFISGPMNRRGDGIYVVPEGCYFFLGDNRNVSKDSRFWVEKYVPIENIEAKARIIIFPFRNFGYIE